MQERTIFEEGCRRPDCAHAEDENKITIRLSEYVAMIRRIQELEHQQQLDMLRREIETLTGKNNDLLIRLYEAGEKTREAQGR
ncbi:MAG: hypothetical protein PUD63_12325 [Clostridia bacterium]|nr:hypothetical protein [Clostridia bacterium]